MKQNYCSYNNHHQNHQQSQQNNNYYYNYNGYSNTNYNYNKYYNENSRSAMNQMLQMPDLTYRYKNQNNNNRGVYVNHHYNNNYSVAINNKPSTSHLTTVNELEVINSNNNSSIESIESLNITLSSSSRDGLDYSNENVKADDCIIDEHEKFDSSPVFINNSKLALQNTWSFWYIKNDRLKNWKDNLIKIIDFSYVEDFWSIYNYLVNPSLLESGSDLALFKAGIEPMWEGKVAFV